MEGDTLDSKIVRLAELVTSSNKIVVFTGAGISTESGIPDFRSPGGIWSKYDMNLFTIQHFLNDAEARKLHWKVLSDDEFIPRHVEPNAAHRAIAELEKMGKLDCVITQNVDFLHEDGGSYPCRVGLRKGLVNGGRPGGSPPIGDVGRYRGQVLTLVKPRH